MNGADLRTEVAKNNTKLRIKQAEKMREKIVRLQKGVSRFCIWQIDYQPFPETYAQAHFFRLQTI